MNPVAAVRWAHVLTNMPSAEQTQNWDKEKWIDALSRSADKNSEWSVVKIETERLFAFVQYKDTATVPSIHLSFFSLKERYR